MTSSGLAFTVLTLVATLAALDLSSAYTAPAPQPATAQASVIRIDQSMANDDVEMRLMKSLTDSKTATPAVAANGPAIHRCVTTNNADNAGRGDPAQYCFGAPVPEIIYD